MGGCTHTHTHTHTSAQREYNDNQTDKLQGRAESKTRIGKYELGNFLGRGSYGSVRAAVNEESGAKVAIKIIVKSLVKDLTQVGSIEQEIKTMNLLHHPHIVRLIEVFHTPSRLYLVLEYAGGGDL